MLRRIIVVIGISVFIATSLTVVLYPYLNNLLEIKKIERFPEHKIIVVSKPSKKYALKGESIYYEIQVAKNGLQSLEPEMIELFGFSAGIEIEQYAVGFYRVNLSNIQTADDMQVSNDDNSCNIGLTFRNLDDEWTHYATSEKFYLTEIYAEISLPSKERITNREDIYFEISFHGDVSLVSDGTGYIVLYGFSANKRILKKNETTYILLLKDVVFDKNNSNRLCSIAVGGGLAIAKNGDMSNSLISEPFYIVDFWEMPYFAILTKTVAIIITLGSILSCILSVLKLWTFLKKD